MTKGRIERRLAVIMATDIVGNSRLMEADEGRTLDAIKRLQASIFSPNIDTRGGRIVKLIKDGALVAFNSAVDALECAISLQEELARDQEELPSGERIVLRIGINLADVVIEGDDLLGDGVYVAARLEASGRAGRDYASPMSCIVSLAESAGPPSWTEARYPSRISPDPFTSGIRRMLQ
ncbi:adenylate/guanylate cyclase domain-containing protein [Sinorhizobium meliloti]|uniref:adenylate/guanylate cyclase domain-containing protein n=1 Tax=Rhizobium meliloti TaxID=382 RepID=UPI001F271FE8|nr:adenylate/guanylate cyclase domain-containing protein [Sinorhizobium meliloti]